MKIIKRDGREVEFDKEKIVNAINKAAIETDKGIDIELAIEIADNIEEDIIELDMIPTVETIQNMVEEYLMDSDRKDIAKKYILYRDERSKLRNNPKWEMTDIQKAIWENKYRYNNESFDTFLNRVSNNNEEIKKLILHKKFIPAGRILAGKGTYKDGKKVTLSNCFVLPPPEDNIESIFDTAKEMARTYSWGGGVGTDISKLRPKDAKVNNAAKTTSGSVSWMDLYSLTTGIVCQHGRRGALMITLDCTHPDIIEFINCKTDLNKVTKANISIKITDDFMRAVENNDDWELYFKVESTGEEIRKTVKAYDIFKLFCKNDWNYAEPSAVFWDRIKNWNLLSEDKEFEYVGLNPCFTGDMKLLTTEGYKTFKELVNKTFKIINYKGEVSEGKVWSNGLKEVVEVKFGNKKTIKCTPDHLFMLNDGTECMAKDLKNKRVMPYIGNINNNFDDLYMKLGFIQGDGCLTQINSNNHKNIYVNIGNKDDDIKKLFAKEIEECTSINKNYGYYIHGYNDILYNLGFDASPLPQRVFPITYTKWSNLQKLSFLRGCYSANGPVITNHRIAYKTTSKVFALQLQKALEEYNINSYITINKSKKVKFNNGEYICKESYDINISKLDSIIKFYTQIGFIQEYKQKALKELIIIRSPKVISIKNIGIQEVFDFTEPITHWGVVEGLVVHNCAEEPLPSYGSCNLCSINLSEFVLHPFTNNAQFDFEKFDYTVRKAVDYMNEILDESIENKLYPLEKQRQMVINWRQIGIGIMGLADMFIKMGIRYGSKESLQLSDKIGFTMINSALQQSALLVKEKGTYPKYKKETILNSKFFKCNANEETRRLVEQYGLRNSQLLTIAPTGSISTMWGISGGIEPIFNYSYIRKTESLNNEETYYKIYTPIVKEYMDKFNIKDEKDLPEFFTNALQLNFYDRIDMQAVWQKHIDASISSTVNLPFTTTAKQVEDLYIYAWGKGLKGVTIYRDGCKRDAVLKSEDNNIEYEKINGICQECNSNNLIKTGGCQMCLDCGWSPCN